MYHDPFELCTYPNFLTQRKSNKGVKMSWQRGVKPKWVGISKWGSNSGKNLGGRPLDALFGACQHLSNLDLMKSKERFKYLCPKLGLCGWKESEEGQSWIARFQNKILRFFWKIYLENSSGAVKDVNSLRMHWEETVWQAWDMKLGESDKNLIWGVHQRGDLQLRDNGTLWQILETGKMNLKHTILHCQRNRITQFIGVPSMPLQQPSWFNALV